MPTPTSTTHKSNHEVLVDIEIVSSKQENQPKSSISNSVDDFQVGMTSHNDQVKRSHSLIENDLDNLVKDLPS